MSWSYSGDPQSSALDAVRFLAQDTDAADPQLEDEEIAYLVALGKSPLYTASEVAGTIAGLYARKIRKQVGRLRLEAQLQFDHYMALSKDLRLRARVVSGAGVTAAGAVPDVFAGGLDTSNPKAFTRAGY